MPHDTQTKSECYDISLDVDIGFTENVWTLIHKGMQEYQCWLVWACGGASLLNKTWQEFMSL